VKVTGGAAWLSAVLILLAGACAGGDGPEAGSPATPTSSTATTSATPSETRTYASEAEDRQRQAYLTHGDDGFVITFSATPTTFDEHLESQRLIESTFRFDD
jgi:hypothetical protein